MSQGVVAHAASDRITTFGELAEAAGRHAVPEDLALKDATDFRLIGQQQAFPQGQRRQD